MTAGGAGRYAKQRPPGIGRKSPLISEYSTILSGKLVSRRGICFPETSQNAMPGLRDASPVPNPPLVGWPRHLPGPQLYHHRLWPKEEGYCSFPNSVIHREDEDRHLMLTKISNRNGIKPNLFSQRPILHPPSA